MKKILFTLILFLIIISVFIPIVSAQGMMNWGNTYSASSSAITSTAQDEEEGKIVWEKLQSKQLECHNLTEDDFDVLGEYFMGQSIGNTERHAAVNQMMKNMMGEKGETQMHISLGKKTSGCDPRATYPSRNGFPLRGGGNSMMGYGWNNFGGWGGFGFGWIMMIGFWIMIIFGVVALVRYLGGQHNANNGNTPLDILKERYAKGEIDKKEFEEKKKDLT